MKKMRRTDRTGGNLLVQLNINFEINVPPSNCFLFLLYHTFSSIMVSSSGPKTTKLVKLSVSLNVTKKTILVLCYKVS